VQLAIMTERLRELRVHRDAALRSGDQARVTELQTDIDELTEDCDKVICAAQAP
jgi:hypothetical protein